MQPDMIERIVDMAVKIQQIPAPTFHESSRAEYIFHQFQAEGLSQVEIDSLGNVYGCLPGSNSDKLLVVSAHTDTVFPIETDLRVSRRPGRVKGPGIGDNSLGVAGLFGLLWSLREQKIQLPGDLWLVANVGEEGLGDLCGMREVVARFDSRPLGYVIIEGLAFGRLYHRGLGVKRYRVEVQTEGGHSWVDYGSPSAIHELGILISNLTQIRLPKRPRTTINVGRVSGGVSINTIAPTAWLELDVRSEEGKTLSQICKKIEETTKAAAGKGVKISLDQIGHREFGEIPRNHPLVKLGVLAMQMQGVEPDLLIGSTDANIPLSRGIPAICIGLTNGGYAHTENEFMLLDNLPLGMAQLLFIVNQCYSLE